MYVSGGIADVVYSSSMYKCKLNKIILVHVSLIIIIYIIIIMQNVPKYVMYRY